MLSRTTINYFTFTAVIYGTIYLSPSHRRELIQEFINSRVVEVAFSTERIKWATIVHSKFVCELVTA